jgi:hypothetical protein
MSAGGEEGKGGRVVLIAVVALIAVFAYFLFFSAPGTPSNAGNVLKQSELAVKSTGKESFTFEGAIEFSSGGSYLGLPVSGEGRIDAKNKRMNFKMNFENPVLEAGATSNGSFTTETFAVGEDVYIDVDGTWGRYTTPGRLWGDVQFSQKMLEFAQGFDATVAGREKVNGREAYKVVVTPTLQELVGLMKTMNPGVMQEQVGDVDLSSIDNGVKSITMTIWIGADDYLPIKIDGSLEAEVNSVNPQGVGAIKSEVKMSLTVNMDYKTPFNIVLPSAALNAPEITPTTP